MIRYIYVLLALSCAIFCRAEYSREYKPIYHGKAWTIETVLTFDDFPQDSEALLAKSKATSGQKELAEQINTENLPRPSVFNFKKYGCDTLRLLFAVYKNEDGYRAVSLFYPKGCKGENDRWESMEIYREIFRQIPICEFCYADSILEVFNIDQNHRALRDTAYKIGKSVSRWNKPRHSVLAENPTVGSDYDNMMASLFKPLSKVPAMYFLNTAPRQEIDEQFVLGNLMQMQGYESLNRGKKSDWRGAGSFIRDDNQIIILEQTVFPNLVKTYLLANPQEGRIPAALEIYCGDPSGSDLYAYFISGDTITVFSYDWNSEFPFIVKKQYRLDEYFTQI